MRLECKKSHHFSDYGTVCLEDFDFFRYHGCVLLTDIHVSKVMIRLSNHEETNVTNGHKNESTRLFCRIICKGTTHRLKRCSCFSVRKAEEMNIHFHWWSYRNPGGLEQKASWFFEFSGFLGRDFGCHAAEVCGATLLHRRIRRTEQSPLQGWRYWSFFWVLLDPLLQSSWWGAIVKRWGWFNHFEPAIAA